MKVAFDEHVPPAFAKVFISLAKERAIQNACKDIELKLAKDYAPKPSDVNYMRRSDVPWLDKFAADGGKGIISGDVKMRENVHEHLTLRKHGFVVIFFEPQWSEWDFFKKTGLLIHWWEEIFEKFRIADAGTFWAVPSAWPITGGQLRNVSTGLLQLLKDNPDRATKVKRVRKKKIKTDMSENVQLGFLDLMETNDAKNPD